MEIVVAVIMLLVMLGFILKLTWHGLVGRGVLALVCALFIGLVWEYAAGQSKTQIAAWLQEPELMLDTSVLLTVDVFFQVTFCILMARFISGEPMGRTARILLAVTTWVPGLLLFPVLFSMLVEVVFALPGIDFELIAWGTAAAVMTGLFLLAWVFKELLPEDDMRLELLALINMLIAILGVIATVNGRTAAVGTNSVEWAALAAVFGLLAIGAAAGLIIYRYSTNKLISKLK